MQFKPPRPYQMNVWRYLERGGKRAICIWHRRAGKDDVALHWAAASMIDKPGSYWHMLPAYSQGRKAIWTSVNPHTGKRRIDEAFPVELRVNTNEQEMFIRLKNGRRGRCWAPTGMMPPWALRPPELSSPSGR